MPGIDHFCLVAAFSRHSKCFGCARREPEEVAPGSVNSLKMSETCDGRQNLSKISDVILRGTDLACKCLGDENWYFGDSFRIMFKICCRFLVLIMGGSKLRLPLEDTPPRRSADRPTILAANPEASPRERAKGEYL